MQTPILDRQTVLHVFKRRQRRPPQIRLAHTAVKWGINVILNQQFLIFSIRYENSSPKRQKMKKLTEMRKLRRHATNRTHWTIRIFVALKTPRVLRTLKKLKNIRIYTFDRFCIHAFVNKSVFLVCRNHNASLFLFILNVEEFAI